MKRRCMRGMRQRFEKTHQQDKRLNSLTRVTLKDPSQSRDAFARVDLTGHDLRSRMKLDTPSYLKWLADDPL
jgi:hypothetical protein